MTDVRGSNLVPISCAEHSQYVAMAVRNLFYSKRGTDFDFRLGEKSVRAHRLIVELFLAPEFIGTVEEEPSVPLVVKQEVPDDGYGSGSNILDFVVEFLYKGEVAIPEQQLEELLGVAKELNFQMLVDAVHTCRPIDIIADEQNYDPSSVTYDTENGNVIAVPRIEDVQIKLGTFGNHGSLQLDVNDEATSQMKFVKLESGDGSEDPRSESEESMGPALSDSENVEDVDSSATFHNQLDPGTLSNPCNNETIECESPWRYKCPHCDFGTPKHSKLENHLLTIHEINSKGEYKCPNCEFETATVSSFRNHCLSVHQLTMRGEPAPLHKCLKCDYTSVYSNSIKLHQSAIHSQEKTHVCPQCSYAGKLKSCLKRHLILVHGVGVSRFTCKVCGKRCASQSALEIHSTIHTAEHPFKCQICSYSARQRCHLKHHMNAIHGESRFTCKVCRERCVSDAALEIHSKIHADERPFKCPHCNYTTSQLHNLNRHLKIHDEEDCRFTCELCRRRCLSLAALERHIRTHTNERPFKCPHCIFDSKHGGSLKRHIQNAHS